MSSNLRFVLGASMLAVVGAAAFFAGQSTGQEKAADKPRLYELRTYTTHPGRLDALNKRFRDHTTKLFEKHGIRNEMYWVPTDEPLSQNTLIYVVSHESADAAKKSWAAFGADPEWIKARDASEADGKIVAKVDKVYMTRTDYSPTNWFRR